jgi:RND family efflux transporter MFP subunit
VLKGATQEDVQQAQAGVDQAQQALIKARQPYTPADLQQQELTVIAADAQLRKAQRPYTDQDFAAAQAAVDQAQAQLEAAELELTETRVVAPVDGIVSERLVAPGALVSPQTPLVMLVPPAVEVLVNVDEAHLRQLSVGQPGKLELAAFPDQTFDAQVASISPTLDARTRTAAVHVKPTDPASLLRAGMFAEVSIVTASRHETLVVPNAAIVGDRSQATVLSVDANNVIRTLPVRIGLQDDNSTEILSGIDEGRNVVTGGASTLRDGDIVTPRPADTGTVAQLAANPE